MELGATFQGEHEVDFSVWAPLPSRLELLLEHSGEVERVPMTRQGEHWTATSQASEGDRYSYLIDGAKKRPDPLSRSQPRGVHDASALVDTRRFTWSDGDWKGVDLKDMVVYELHVGTFTRSATFEGVIGRLDHLRSLGVSAVELMPVAQFPGDRNWGYDGVYPFAPQHSYGGVRGLQRLVDSAHSKGLAILLDVVYNHFGPEGNYLTDFAPYLTSKYKTPWGEAMNFDDSYSDGVREMVKENALYWLREFHVDGLRLDAIHAIFDFSPKHILRELGEVVHEFGRSAGKAVWLIAESDLNDPKIVRPVRRCGYGVDSQWSDDFHHAVHAYLTKERSGYYQDFGGLPDVAKALARSFVVDGRYSGFRKRRHGAPVGDLPGSKFVFAIQNHDQIGNRPDGARLTSLVPGGQLEVAAALLLLSPSVPLIFMGEEYGETAPFYYFTSHSDKELISAVREGRRREYEAQGWKGYYDPQSLEAFEDSRLDFAKRTGERGRRLVSLYTQLIDVRRTQPAFHDFDRGSVKVTAFPESGALALLRSSGTSGALCLFAFGGPAELSLELSRGSWGLVLSRPAGLPATLDGGRTSVKIPACSFGVYSRGARKRA